MKRLWNWAFGYLAAGIGMELVMVTVKEAVRGTASPSGLAVHGHLLLLGFGFHLMLIVLDRLFDLRQERAMGGALALYNVGLIGAAAVMAYKGLSEILGGIPSTMVVMAVSAVAHILISIALFRCAFAIKRAIQRSESAGAAL